MTDMTHEIMDIIRSGDVDDNLAVIEMAIRERRSILAGQKRVPEIPRTDFHVGCTVKVTGKLKPNYLFGHTFEAKKVNHKTVVVDVPDHPLYRRFAGHNGVRIPKTALQVVA